jgi:hypothetical protein
MITSRAVVCRGGGNRYATCGADVHVNLEVGWGMGGLPMLGRVKLVFTCLRMGLASGVV